MPRTSQASLSVVHFEPSLKRPEPPSFLSAKAAVHWKRIVDGMPPDWFPVETQPMLAQLCRMIVRSQSIANALDKAEAAGADMCMREYQNMIRAEVQLSMCIAQLSTKMRISQQSSGAYDKNRKRKGRKVVPWQDDQDAS